MDETARGECRIWQLRRSGMSCAVLYKQRVEHNRYEWVMGLYAASARCSLALPSVGNERASLWARAHRHNDYRCGRMLGKTRSSRCLRSARGTINTRVEVSLRWPYLEVLVVLPNLTCVMSQENKLSHPVSCIVGKCGFLGGNNANRTMDELSTNRTRHN